MVMNEKINVKRKRMDSSTLFQVIKNFKFLSTIWSELTLSEGDLSMFQYSRDTGSN